MILTPQSKEDLARQLAAASASDWKIAGADLAEVAALVEHTPEDMTATVEAGMTLHAFQERLRRAGQWLPLDPPHAENLSIGDLLAFDRSGPRRLGYGVARDYLIGMQVALGDGQIIKAGGKVVKNVAGYDLCKLFIGARHTLGFIVEATFKLRPLPELEIFLEAKAGSLDELDRIARALLSSAAEPVLLDAHNGGGSLTVVTAFAGMREDVEAQSAIAQAVGFSRIDPPGYNQQFWSEAAPQKVSVLPVRTVETIRAIGPAEFLAHLGNGVIYFLGGTVLAKQPLPAELMERVKSAYDPKQILPLYSA